MSDPWKAGFARFLEACAPYLDEIVIAGGWASRLHRLASHASPPAFEPLLTDDVDAALRIGMRVRDERLDVRLKTQGFTERLSSDFIPPVTHYELAEPEGFEVEFLADQRGAYYKRDGSPDRTVAIAGVTAQKLHYMGLLLVEPWTVTIAAADGYPIATPSMRVKIPNPTSYVVQKLLIRKDRDRIDKRVKDVLYIHDTIELFALAEGLLRREWEGIKMKMHGAWRERCIAAAERIGSPSHPDVIAATRLARSVGRSTSAHAIASVLRAGLVFLRE